MLRIAICDDNTADREALYRLLCEACARQGEASPKVVEYAAGEMLLSDLGECCECFDLLFLDIYMAGLSGMELARRLRGMGCRTPLIFLTSTPDFAVESYTVKADGYLLKPPTVEKLSTALERVLAVVDRPRVSLRCGREHRYFYLDRILFAESRNSTVYLRLADGSEASLKGKLNDIEESLSDPRFLRCHQSFLVNMDYIADVEQDFLLRNGTVVPIRVRSRREMTERYYRYFVSRTVERLPTEVNGHV